MGTEKAEALREKIDEMIKDSGLFGLVAITQDQKTTWSYIGTGPGQTMDILDSIRQNLSNQLLHK